jgi:hypothetical protein
MTATMTGQPELVKSRPAQWALALACVLLWAVKFWLIPRLNINWDEFYFLNHVHAATRHELTQGLQTSYTHLFTWLPQLPGDEISQIRVARVLMVALLGFSALLIQRLATRWFTATAAWTAALAFLAMWPTLKHAGSFRADSLLLPLHLAALVVLTHPRLRDSRRDLGAGLLLGIATAISIKTVLLAPVVIALGIGEPGKWRRGLTRLAWLAAAALATAAGLLGAHLLSMSGQGGGAAAAAQNALQTTVGNMPWIPQRETLQQMLRKDWVFWLAAGAGLAWALWRRLWSAAACVLALLPVVFYRNSFAYYYVVMWGPACIVIAAASAGISDLASRVARPVIAKAAAFSLAVLLCAQGMLHLTELSALRQDKQRLLVAAVHKIFPVPVAYIDHSGMVASFRKANMFMSSWGMAGYSSGSRPFMPAAIARLKPPLLIGNRPVLVPGTFAFGFLLPEDREIISSSYLPYWGPIRVAGAAGTINGAAPAVLALPFAGRYRLETPQPVSVAGNLLESGAVISVSAERLRVPVAASPEAATQPFAVRLIWADAHPPPPAASAPASLNYYDPL